MGATVAAPGQPPTPQAEAWAIAAVLHACRTGGLELAEAEDRLHAIYAARTLADVYTAIAGLPHPPAPLVIEDRDRHRRAWRRSR